MATSDLHTVAAECAPGVALSTLRAIYTVESAGNPYAIGVVGGRLKRQPTGLAEAVSTAHELQRRRIRFSAGAAQIYVGNWPTLGLNAVSVFDPCTNLRSAAHLLQDCFQRAGTSATTAQDRLRRAISCYYSGNFHTGFSHGYVQKVVAAAKHGAVAP
jgi:type IV secretion system protein VirB1